MVSSVNLNYRLCLSGGGYRATFFHLGVLRRLYQLGLLGYIDEINSVSGGSIAAGSYMTAIRRSCDFASLRDFDCSVIAPVIRMSQSWSHTDFFKGRRLPEHRYLHPSQLVNNLNISNGKFQRLLSSHLFGCISFAELPAQPLWRCLATNLTSGRIWSFSQKGIGDVSTGYTEPRLSDGIAFAVAASAGIPPVFTPSVYSLKGRNFSQSHNHLPGRGDTLSPAPFDYVRLVDGGVADNLASYSVSAEKEAKPFIISDASESHNCYTEEGTIADTMRMIELLMEFAAVNRRNYLYEKLRGTQSTMFELSRSISLFTSDPDVTDIAPEKRRLSHLALPAEVCQYLGRIRTHLDDFHDLEIAALIFDGSNKLDASLKRFAPDLIRCSKLPWDSVPQMDERIYRRLVSPRYGLRMLRQAGDENGILRRLGWLRRRRYANPGVLRLAERLAEYIY